MNKRFMLFITMLVMAIVAVGSVSATEDIVTDIDAQTDDIAVEEDVENDLILSTEESDSTITVDNTMSLNQIQGNITDAADGSTILFTTGTYNDITLNLRSNVVLDGQGSTLIGDGTHDIFLVTQTSNLVIKNFIINVNNASHGIYGHHVYNTIITNNTIYNCEDAINIYQVHENLTITDNTINASYDGISLVNFNTYSDSQFANFIGSVISGNKINGGTYGMFFGGNFKGDIYNNTITGSTYAMEFKGKRSATNGKLNATMSYNTITEVTTGISMDNPELVYLKMLNNTVNTTSTSNYAILAGSHFDFADNKEIILINNTFTGLTSIEFYDEIYINSNNTGLISDEE